MKRFFTLIFLSLFTFQVAQTQCDLPGGSFEDFVDITADIEYDFNVDLDSTVYLSEQWVPLVRFLLFAFSEAFYTLTGVQLTQFIANGLGQGIYTPGALGTERALKMTPGQYINFADAYTAMPCGERPEVLKGHYRHVGAANDTLIVYTLLNDTITNLDFLSEDFEDVFPIVTAHGLLTIEGGEDEYTSFEIPLVYENDLIPDSAMVYIISVVDSASIANGNEAYHVVDEFSFGMSTSSTSDLNNADLINVFPNPTNGVINIESEEMSIQNIRIFNTFGQLIYESNNRTNKETITLNNFSPGIYFVDADMGEFVSRKKFMVIE
jgi:hypothetical protein